MKRAPLTQLSVLNHVNPLFQNLPLTHKLSSSSRGNTCSDAKLDLETSDNTTTFHDLQPVTGTVFDRIEQDMDSPVQSPGSKTSSIQKKSIKKDKSAKKFKSWLRLREKRPTKGSKAAENTKQSSLNLAYSVTPKKFLSQLMGQQEKNEGHEEVRSMEKEVKIQCENKENTTSGNLTTGCSKNNSMIDKNIYCLNWIPKNVTKLQVSGISVFFEEEEEDSYAFPANIRTVKFVV